jgi:starch phosphorylase
VTNGVHIPTWLGKPMWELLNRHLGEDWLDRATDPATWEPVDDIPAKEIWAVRTQQRSELIEYVRHRAVFDRLARDEPMSYAQAAGQFDPDILTVGFARRLATYKRLNLLLQDVERAMALVAGDRPIQVLLAGKAHPRDDAGKGLVQGLFSMKNAPGFAGRVAYLDDYDLRMAAHLVRGCDVWINLPRPPLEASGTSGMKAMFNGCLHLSVLDGWWAEACEEGVTGWAIGEDGSPEIDHADDLYDKLENVVLPLWHKDRARWVALMKQCIARIGSRFHSQRMMRRYAAEAYLR